MKRSAWRELLGELAATPAEKQRVARELGVRTWTISRWIAGEGEKPRIPSLRRLPDLFPDHRSRFRRLLLKEFPNLFPVSADEEKEEAPISLTFYERFLWSLANQEQPVSSWTIREMGLQQLLSRLRKEKETVRILLLRLTPPVKAEGCRSLHRIAGHSKPAHLDQEVKTALYGSNSLAGRATSSGQVQMTDAKKEIAMPLKRYGAIAGCLLVEDSEPITEYYQRLIEKYAHLLTLQFRESDFYQKEQIQLQEFPSIEQQQAELARWPSAPISVSILIEMPPVEIFQQIETYLLGGEEKNDGSRERA